MLVIAMLSLAVVRPADATTIDSSSGSSSDDTSSSSSGKDDSGAGGSSSTPPGGKLGSILRRILTTLINSGTSPVGPNGNGGQQKANQATTFTMTTGTVARALVNSTVLATGTITNSTPAGGTNLTISLSSGGILWVTNLQSGTTSLAPQTSTTVSGSIQTGATAGTRTWSVINTDTSALTTTSTAAGTLQVVDQRVFTPSPSTLALGYVHQGATVSGPSVVISSTGLHATTADATLGSFTGGPTGFALVLTSGSNRFDGATFSQTATYSIAGTASQPGSLNGSYASAVTAEFGSIPDVSVGVTGQVYSGQSTWVTDGGGNWGTLTGTGANAFGLNWNAAGGSPGLDPGFTNTDAATFGSAVTSGTVTINTNGATISLRALSFDNANASYRIVQNGGSGAITLQSSGTTPASVSAAAGSHKIQSNILLGSTADVDVAADAALTFENSILGGRNAGLNKSGAGTLYLNGSNSYGGGTVVEAGTLSGRGSVTGLVDVQSGATLAVGSEELAYGVFRVTSLALNPGSTTILQISGTTPGVDYDKIAFTGGSLTYGGELSLILTGSYALNTSFSLFDQFVSHYGTLSGVSLTATGSPYDGLTFTRSEFSGDVVWWTNANSSGQSLKFAESTGELIVVPEPSTVVIASIGAALAALWRFRRRKPAPEGDIAA